MPPRATYRGILPTNGVFVKNRFPKETESGMKALLKRAILGVKSLQNGGRPKEIPLSKWKPTWYSGKK
jgi:hypothetical protein